MKMQEESMQYDRQLQRSTDRELDLIECEDQLIGELRALQRAVDDTDMLEAYKNPLNNRIGIIEEKIKMFFSVAVSIEYIEDLATVEEMTKYILKHKIGKR